jgi:hypothetical protein
MKFLFEGLLVLSSGLAGFGLGRIGDKYFGYVNFMHHWIYGLVLILIGIFFIKSLTGIALISFGIGHFLSDLDDFLNFRVWGADIPHKWKFWSVK